MKKITPIFLLTVATFSVGGFAQQLDRNADDLSMLQANSISDDLNNDLAIVTYRVEERVRMAYASNITSYLVSDLSLVSKVDLGPNNTRVVTPIYSKGKAKQRSAVEKLNNAAPAAMTIAPIKVEMAPIKSKKKYINIDLIGTYERVLEKGYKNVDLLKKVSNARFFDGDLEGAAKWYTVLFSLTTDFEPVYYYRYAQSLKAVNQLEKSEQMMVLFKQKDL